MVAGALITAEALRPVDFLLYRPSSIFGYAIRFHTGHNISHVEVYIGGGQSTASRDGKGPGTYPLRLDHLAYVMRPRMPVDRVAGLATGKAFYGLPYGWIELLDFFGFAVNGRGIVCSPYATVVGRAAGVPLFNQTQARLVAPFQFVTDELLSVAWTDGKDVAIDAAPV